MSGTPALRDTELDIRHCETPDDLVVARTLRFKVYVEEEKLKKTNKDELDGKDEASDVFLLFKSGTPVGTVRYYPHESKLGRLAVLSAGRGAGAGRLLVAHLEEHVINRRGTAGRTHSGQKYITLVANSRVSVQGFYAKLGYTAEGDIFIEEGEPHIRISKTLGLVCV